MIVLIFVTNMTIIAVPLVITTDQLELPGEAITARAPLMERGAGFPARRVWVCRARPSPEPTAGRNAAPCQSEPEGHSSAWRSGDFGGSVAGRDAFNRVSCHMPHRGTRSAAWAPGARGGGLGRGHRHFVQFHMKVGARLFLEARFTRVIKTHTSRRLVPWRGGDMPSGVCSPLEGGGRRRESI